MATGKPLYAKENRRLRTEDKIDLPFLLILLCLLAVGLTMLYSASCAQSAYDTGYTDTTRYLQKQAICAALGLGAMALASRIPTDFWFRAATWTRWSTTIPSANIAARPTLTPTAAKWASVPTTQPPFIAI